MDFQDSTIGMEEMLLLILDSDSEINLSRQEVNVVVHNKTSFLRPKKKFLVLQFSKLSFLGAASVCGSPHVLQSSSHR